MEKIKVKLPGVNDFFSQEAYKSLRTNLAGKENGDKESDHNLQTTGQEGIDQRMYNRRTQ